MGIYFVLCKESSRHLASHSDSKINLLTLEKKPADWDLYFRRIFAMLSLVDQKVAVKLLLNSALWLVGKISSNLYVYNAQCN